MYKNKLSAKLHAITGTSIVAGVPAALAVIFVILCNVHSASAKPGTHGWAVSTWDTTRSTVVFNYEHGFMSEDGSSNIIGYNANFTSTTGRLSSQFGLQYMNMTPTGMNWTLHGGSGSVVAVYGIPVTKRYDNGLPKAALSLYAGTVPAVLSNGQYNYVTVPFVVGLGMELSPIRHLSIVPWVEGAVSFNFDTIVRYEELRRRINEIVSEFGTVPSSDEIMDHLTFSYDDQGLVNGVTVDDTALEEFLPEELLVPEEILNELLSDVIEYETQLAFRFRGGLSVVVNIGDRMDLQINATVAQVGSDFDAPPTWFVGTALAIAWDDAPLGILPEAHRANLLSCDTVSTRFQSCSEYHQLINEIREEEAAKLNRNKTIVVHEEKKTPQKPASPPPPSKTSTPPQNDTTAAPPRPSPAVTPVPEENTSAPAVAPAQVPEATPAPPPAKTPLQPQQNKPAGPPSLSSPMPSLSEPINK